MYDLIILGGGPGGYMAAERAGTAGLRTLLIEKDRLGGVCLNRGCIPTKTLLHSAKLYHHAQEAERFGVFFAERRYDLARAMEWKDQVVDKLVQGVETLMKRHRVEVVSGSGKLVGRDAVEVGGDVHRGSSIIVATGSSPVRLPVGDDDGFLVTSDEILSLRRLPRRLVIIGGGVIGMEFASYFRMVGCEVTVVEMLSRIIPNLDGEIAALAARAFRDVTFHLSSRVARAAGGRVVVEREGERVEVEADLALMSVGRRPNVEDVGLESAGVEFSVAGIRVDERLRTSVPGIYAVGDVNGRSLLAHSAYRMAEVAVNTILGRPDRMRYRAIPWVVYSDPELAGVGLTEELAGEQGRKVLIGRIPLRANGRFLAEHGPAAGMCKVLVDPATRVLLGAQIAGGPASEMIYGAAAMIEAELRVQDMREIVFPHPTVSEAFRDVLWSKPFE